LALRCRPLSPFDLPRHFVFAHSWDIRIAFRRAAFIAVIRLIRDGEHTAVA